MIFWATVLTFIIGIMIAMMFPRTDLVKVKELPVSEAYVASFIAQHQFARDYSRHISFTLPYITPITGNDNPTGDAAFVHVFKDEFDDIDTGYMPEIMPNEVSRLTFPTDGSFTSAIICLDALDKGENANRTFGNIVSCQTPAQTFKYVLTYGVLFPEGGVDSNLFKSRINSETNRNRILWEKALEERTKGDPDCGILGSNNGTGVIYSAHAQGRTIPQAIYNLYDNYTEDVIDLQPVFCITPINTPYKSDGLIYHLDSIMNGTNTTGAPIHVNETTDGWNNIVTQTPVTINTASTEWNPDNDTPLAFQEDTFLSLPISGKNDIKNEFSVSILGNFDIYELGGIDAQAPLFSTNDGSFPRVVGFYNAGSLFVEVYLSEGVKIGELRSPIPRSMVSITYVLGPRFHHIFYNGSLAATQTFTDNQFLTDIKSQTLHIGASQLDTTNKLNADIYNIKVYNRTLSQDEINYNLRTDKQRYNF